MGSTAIRWLAVSGLLLCGPVPWPTLAQQQQPSPTSDNQQVEATAINARLVPNCIVRCSLPTGTQANQINQLATSMTQRIVHDVQNGQLTRQQIGKPFFFEHRVVEQLNQQQLLEREHSQKLYTPLGTIDGDEHLMQRQQVDLQQQIHRNLFEQPQFVQVIAHHQQQQQQQQQQHSSSSQQQQFQQSTQFSALPQYVSQRQPTVQQMREHHRRIQEQHYRQHNANKPQQTRVQQTRHEQSEQIQQQYEQQQQNRPVVIRTQLPNSAVQTAERSETRTEEHHNTVPAEQPSFVIRTQLPNFAEQTAERGETRIEEQRNSVHAQQPALIAPHSPRFQHHEHRQQISEQHTTSNRTPSPTIVYMQGRPQTTTVVRNYTTTTVETHRKQPNVHISVAPAQTTETRHTVEQRQQSNSLNQQRQQPAIFVRQSQPSTIVTQQRNVDTVHEQRNSRLPQTQVYRPADDAKYFVQHERTVYEQERTRQPAAPRPTVVIPSPVRSEQQHTIYRYLEQSSDGQMPNYQPQWRLDLNEESLRQQHHQQQEAVTTTTTTTTPAPRVIERELRIVELQRDLQSYNIRPFSLRQLQSAVRTGHFWDSTQLYVFNTTSNHFMPAAVPAPRTTSQINTTITTTTNTNSGRQLPVLRPLPDGVVVHQDEQLTREQYIDRIEHFRQQLQTFGYTTASQQMLDQIVRRGGFELNGVHHVFPAQTQTTSTVVQTDTADVVHERRVIELRDLLQAIGQPEFGEFERNQTLRTGVFIRAGTKYTYDNQTHLYIGERLSEHEVQRIYERLQQLLRHYSLRETTHAETERMLQSGGFCRGGWRWVYDWRSGSLEHSGEHVGQLVELSADEYQQILKRIEETLERLGYGQMTEQQCNATVVSGSFERGGITYHLNTENNIFTHVTLDQNTYAERVQLLRELLTAIGHQRHLTEAELNSIIYRGHFEYQNHRYEYNPATRHYEQQDITGETFERLVAKLQQQLEQIGYEHMSLVERNQTIYTQVFHFNGGEWLYRYDTELFERSADADSTSLPADGVTFTPETVYSAAVTTETAIEVPAEELSTTRQPVVSRNRGDQPPQTFVDDYSAEVEVASVQPAIEQVVEQEPGIGYYPVEAVEPAATEANVVENTVTAVEQREQTLPAETKHTQEQERDDRDDEPEEGDDAEEEEEEEGVEESDY